MIRINLLPSEEVERAADQRQQIATVGLVLAVGLLAPILLHSVQAARFATTNRRLTSVTTELQDISGQYADVLKIQAQQKELEEKLKVITQLEARSSGPVHMLTDLSSAMPEKLWLVEFAESGGAARVSGFGVDEQTIADFLRRLGTSSYFTQVDLDETTQVTEGGVKQKKFVLKAQVNYAGQGQKPAQIPQRSASAGEPVRTAAAGGVVP